MNSTASSLTYQMDSAKEAIKLESQLISALRVRKERVRQESERRACSTQSFGWRGREINYSYSLRQRRSFAGFVPIARAI